MSDPTACLACRTAEESARMARVLRSAGWSETPQGWRTGSSASLPLAEAYAELRRQMRSAP